jgi:DNA ligase (NAD+)
VAVPNFGAAFSLFYRHRLSILYNMFMKKVSKNEAKKRISKLKEVIDHHRYLYHVLDKVKISDAAHDSLKHELYELEQEFPDLITADSPTQRVGGEPLAKFEKLKHASRMLSMEDIFSEDELHKWVERLEKIADTSVDNFFCMHKIDGLAISLTYKDGRLETAATRGDGRVGENVTQNIKTIDAIPLMLREVNGVDLRGNIEVRGEIFMEKDAFEQMNKELKKEGKKTFANPRNVSAGSVRQLDPKIAALRPLDFRAWHLGDIGQETQDDSIRLLKSLGFKTTDSKHVGSLKRAIQYFQSQEKGRERLPHWIDGIVIRVNNHLQYEELGIVGKAPRGLIAWKFPPEEVTTRVLSVDWNVGRTGRLTPIAGLEPVFVAGTTVKKASLHNFDEIKRLGLKIGDTIILTKAGDIIPKITSVLKDLRTGEEKGVSIPKNCPVCGSGILKKEGQVDLVCENKGCFSMERERILHAARAFGIDGLGGKRIEHFIHAGFLSSPADIFKLNKSEIAELDGYGEKSANQIVDEIQAHKEIGLADFIKGLGITNVGAETAHDLARRFETIEDVSKSTVEELESIQDIGSIVAQSVFDFFASDYVRELLRLYIDAGVTIHSSKLESRVLEGKVFVITGTLKGLTRDEAQERIRMHGGDISGSVSKKTDFVLVGENPGSKYEKAKKLGVKTLSERDLLDML